MKLILVRHGQSTYNLENRFTGWKDVGLTQQGMDEAILAGNLLKKNNIIFTKAYASMLKRSQITLNIILNEMDLKLKPIINQALNERDYGDLIGQNKEDAAKKFGEEQVQIWRRSYDIPPPQMEPEHPYKNKIKSDILSESLKDTFNRVVPYFNKKIKPFILSKKNILIVFHGNSCRALLMKILNISKEKITKFEIPTGNPLLIKFNDKLKVQEFKYLDTKRAKKILFNV